MCWFMPPPPQVPWCSKGFGLTLAHGRMSTIIGTVEEESAAQVGGAEDSLSLHNIMSCDSHMTWLVILFLQSVGVVPRQSVVALGNHYVPVAGLPDAKLQELVQMYNDLQSPLPLTVMQTPQL